MKILQVIYSLSSGGGERFVLDLSNELCRGNEVCLCTLRKETEENKFYKKELSEQIVHKCLNLQKGLKIRDLIRTYRFVKQTDPDVVHFHLNNIALYFILPILFFKKARYYQTVHSDIQNGNYGFLSKFLGRFLFGKRVKLITISNTIDRISRKVYALGNTRLIYNGRSIPKISSDISMVSKEVSGYKETANDIVFVHIGRFHEQKNQKLLIESFSMLKAVGYPFVLLIIGRGFQCKEAEDLRMKAEGKGIFFLGEKSNVVDYLSLADAFCLSSLSEGMSIAFIEAFACGCIPVCTPVSGCMDVIQNGINGFIAKDFTVQSYVDALKAFLQNKDGIQKQSLIKIYEERFTMEKCATSYLSFFKESACPN